MSKDYVQKFDVTLHGCAFQGLSHDQAVAKMQAFMDLGVITIDTTFGEKIPVVPPLPVERATETWYVCSQPGCSYRSRNLSSVRAHRGRVHALRTIKVTR
jgi:hypothetical protein